MKLQEIITPWNEMGCIGKYTNKCLFCNNYFMKGNSMQLLYIKYNNLNIYVVVPSLWTPFQLGTLSNCLV